MNMRDNFVVLAKMTVLATCFLCGVARAEIIYVDASASGNNDGSTWANAFNSLQDALVEVGADGEIWVAAGTYRPDQGIDISLGNREATFHLANNVAIYGGFPSGGGEWWSRNPTAHTSTLSGDLNSNDGSDFANYSENSYHVVTGSGTDATAVLDGFTIKGGNANGTSPHEHGGGMYNNGGNLTIDHCTFRVNSASSTGGGMYNFGASPVITHCHFHDNRANYGGGMSNRSYSNPEVSYCNFIRNLANYCGGGMCNWPYSDPTLTNCTFQDNTADENGGGMFNYNHSDPKIYHTDFKGNFAEGSGGGIYSQDGNPEIIYCIFSDNTANSKGGGIHNFTATATAINCQFYRNIANESGGGICNWSYSDSAIANCLFSGNRAVVGGGGICNWPYSDPTIACCSFSYNSSKIYGGGIDNYNHSNAAIYDCIFWGNIAPDGPQISLRDKSTVSVGYSDVQGGNGNVYVDGATLVWSSGNINADPLFIDADGVDGQHGTYDDDLRLSAGSPCIDAGDNTAIPPDIIDLDDDEDTTEAIPFDLDGLPRRIDDGGVSDTGEGTPPLVDMGAYEHTYPCDFNFSGSVDFKDFSILANHWLEINCGSCDGADLTGDRGVAIDDLQEFTHWWLAGH